MSAPGPVVGAVVQLTKCAGASFTIADADAIVRRLNPSAACPSPAPETDFCAIEDPPEPAIKFPPLTVAEALALPALNGPAIICRLWSFRSPSQFHRLDKQGAFDFLKVVPAVGPKRFSGVLIARYLCREPLFLSSFGRQRSR